ncbi:thioredoxin family protein [Colwellia sp. Arc7-635]|uniref:thioredoxin family protein n=1 Tax=Colwellia sp. Arc7-635 TaxID=2497879 RepID=UPI000F84FF81|nr:thioredoxin family protein [Colwellia sp. Arc7-635]AZQ85579.1 thioredoxin family protein [Colwellia sp. Arc7-635]
MRVLSAILLSFILVASSACAASHEEKNTMALGEISQQQLVTNYRAFQDGYQKFQLSKAEINQIKRWPDDLHIDVYFGSWCHDSEREVPRFLKMMAENSTLSNRLIGLNYDKLEPGGSAKKHEISYTPTFVVYQNNREIGRIIERPNVSLTADISAMLTK